MKKTSLIQDDCNQMNLHKSNQKNWQIHIDIYFLNIPVIFYICSINYYLLIIK